MSVYFRRFQIDVQVESFDLVRSWPHFCTFFAVRGRFDFQEARGCSKFSVKSLQELQNQYKGSELKFEIARLEQALYAKEKISGWRGNDLLTQVNKLRDTLPKNIEAANLLAEINP